jgi:dTDP-glucose 4,6-dehydratase
MDQESGITHSEVLIVHLYIIYSTTKVIVYPEHTRTSTYIYDAVNTFSNIAENFKDGEIYNISSSYRHTIQELIDLCLKYTSKSDKLVEYRDTYEILTTKHKIVDNSKSRLDLEHIDTTSLDQGVKNTVEWMKQYYKIN